MTIDVNKFFKIYQIDGVFDKFFKCLPKGFIKSTYNDRLKHTCLYIADTNADLEFDQCLKSQGLFNSFPMSKGISGQFPS